MRNGDNITKSIGQSSARWQVLGRIGYEPQTVAKMARDMGHARQSVQRVADVLVNEKLAVYQANPADRRAQLLGLTPKGAKTLADIYAAYGAWSQHIMTKLSPEQLTAAAEALESIGQILETDINNNKE